jgi:hypothetical protein
VRRLDLGRLGSALVALSKTEQRLDRVRAVLAGADVTGVATYLGGASVVGASVGGLESD